MLNKLNVAMFIAILLSSSVFFTVKAETAFATGVSLSPKSYQPSDFSEFFVKARQAGNIVSWAGDWDDLAAADKAPEVVAELASIYNYTPLIEAQFFTQSTGQLLRPLNDTIKQNYTNKTVQFASKYKPKYLALGIEVNVLYDKSPTDFENFAGFYSEVYDAVKGVSPTTSVFTIFQLEKMKGLNGGLFGGENNSTNAQWFLIDRFPKSDIIAFTTYPSLVFKNPSEIPLDYYSEISSHTTKTIAFTESGWHTAPTPTEWEGSEEKQADFVKLFFNYTQNLNKEFAIWSFLYDQNVTVPFNSMGFFGTDGSSKLAWNTWIQLTIPEFPSFLVLSLFMVAALPVIIVVRRKLVTCTVLSSSLFQLYTFVKKHSCRSPSLNT